MPSSLTAAPAIAGIRRVVPWLAGPAVLLLRADAVELVPPSACPGLLELLSIAAVRAKPDVRIGQVFGALHLIVVVASLAAFAALVQRRTRRAAVALATAVAVGMSPLFPSALAPPIEAAAFGLCAAAALAWLAIPEGSARAARMAMAIGGSLAVALIVPAWLLPAAAMACVAGAAARPQGRRAARALAGAGCAAAATVAAVAILGISAPDALGGGGVARSLAACVAPAPSAARAAAVATSLGFWLGPFALGLAALGAFAAAPAAGWRAALLACSVVVLGVSLAATSMTAAAAIAPAAVLLWWLAAIGLSEIIDAVGRRPASVLVAASLLLLAPALSAARRVNDIRDDAMRPRGHEQETLREMTSLLNLVPQEATFVEEDATVDVLLRAAVVGGRRRLKPVTVLARNPEVVARSLAGHALYAFPSAQEDLSLRGFLLEPPGGARGAGGDASHRISGLASIAGRRPCAAMTGAWTAVSGVSGRVALSADSEAARGPVTMYFGGNAAGQPAPDAWPPRTLRGFRFAVFDQLAGPRSDRLVAEANEAGLALDSPVLAQPFVIRLTLHRTPRAPRGLAAALGAPFSIGVARLDPDAARDGTLTVCDAPGVVVSPLPSRE
jgi:hypothetical protein